jgi:hypothetical protein
MVSWSDIAQRAAAVMAAQEDIAKAEALQIIKNPAIDTVRRAEALNRIKRAKDGLKNILDGLPAAGPAAPDALQQAMADCTLTYVEAVIAYSPSADMRAAQFHGYGLLAHDHKREIDAARGANAMNSAADLIDKIGKATKVVRGIAKDPLGYVGVLQFWNKLVAPDPGLQKFKLLPNVSMPEITFNDLIENDLAVDEVFKEFQRGQASQLSRAQVDAIMKSLQLTAKDLEIAAAWLGAAVVLITATTLVLNTLADERHWATAFAKGAVSIAVPLALSQLITAAAVTPLVTAAVSATGSVFGFAAATIEVPPVAFVLVATGLVMLISIAVEELFSFLLTTIFGGDIPKSMRAEMAMPIATSMRMQMSAPMLASLH